MLFRVPKSPQNRCKALKMCRFFQFKSSMGLETRRHVPNGISSTVSSGCSKSPSSLDNETSNSSTAPHPFALARKNFYFCAKKPFLMIRLWLWLVSNSFLLAHLASVEVNPIYQGLLKWVLSVDWRLVLQPRTITFLPLKSAAHFTVTRGHFSKSLEECIHCVLCSVLTYLVGGLSLSVP